MQPILIVPLCLEMTVTLLVSVWGGTWLYVLLTVLVQRLRRRLVGLTRS